MTVIEFPDRWSRRAPEPPAGTGRHGGFEQLLLALTGRPAAEVAEFLDLDEQGEASLVRLKTLVEEAGYRR